MSAIWQNMISRDALKASGAFDTSLFVYVEEVAGWIRMSIWMGLGMTKRDVWKSNLLEFF
jgi:hypothetical protein